MKLLNKPGSKVLANVTTLDEAHEASKYGAEVVVYTHCCFQLFEKILKVEDLEIRKAAIDKLLLDVKPKGVTLDSAWASFLEKAKQQSDPWEVPKEA